MWTLAATLLAVASTPPVAPKLSDPNATAETKSLMRYLQETYGKQIISGQCDDKYLPFIQQHSGGKSPAMMGYDFNGICPGQNGNRDVEKATKWVKERGGIATFQWHWISPNGDGDFYTKNFDLKKAVADRTSKDWKNIVRDIDLLAVELKALQKAKVPILWRPLHEAEGKWFWWGMGGGDACKTLYRYMFDRLTKHHKIHNLIWVWTSYGNTKENWYPGDDVVDLVVWDYEAPESWPQLNELFGGKKLLGLGEEGKLPDPANFKARPWLYFLTWAYMIEDPQKGNTPDWIRKVYNDPLVVTLDELPKDLYRRPHR